MRQRGAGDERIPEEATQADNYCDLNSRPGPSWALVSLGLPRSFLLVRGLRMECSGISRCVTNACSVISEDQGWSWARCRGEG